MRHGSTDRSVPGVGAVVITAGASALAKPIRSLFVSGAGNVTFTGADGNSCVHPVPDNYVIPVEMTHVTAYSGSGTLVGYL